MKSSITAMVTAAALMLAASAPTFAATSDTQTSADNSKLTCTLSVSIQAGKAVVTWTITGATGASIDPLTFQGKVPLTGTQTVDYDGNIIVVLTAKDADGHTVRCHVGAGAAPVPPPGPTVGHTLPSQGPA